MQLIKRLTQTLSAGSISLTFTDSLINNNSIIEVYADSIDVYPTALSQSGTSVIVQFDEQPAAHSILLLINNIVSLSDPTLATLLDVDLSTLNDDDILTYDETADKWVNAKATAADISYNNTDSGLTATNVQDAIDEVFQSVSDGKELIADAITDKGVPTSATDTFSTMATNISNISGGGGINITEYTNRGVSVRSTSGTNTLSLDATKEYIIVGNARSSATYNVSSLTVTFSSDGTVDVLLKDYAQAGTSKPYVYICHVTGATTFTAAFSYGTSGDICISAFYK